MKTHLQTVTPEKAADWLTSDINRDNRLLRDHFVNYLAQEILRGKWQTTHQGLAFSEDGRLLDGQHRLTAIVRSGKAVDILVTTGLPNETYQVIDCGLKRGNHERLHLVEDKAQNFMLTKALRAYLWSIRPEAGIAVSHLEAEFNRAPDSWMWAIANFKGHNQRLARPNVLASFGVYHSVNPDKASEFKAGFIDGADLKLDSPILKLRTLALTGTHKDTTYWRCQAAMRAHLNRTSVRHLCAAIEDMLGNSNSRRLIKARTQRGIKAAITRRKAAG
jgi:hypothetical protein